MIRRRIRRNYVLILLCLAFVVTLRQYCLRCPQKSLSAVKEKFTDQATILTNSDLAEYVNKAFTNFPILSLQKYRNLNIQYNTSCAKFPKFETIQFNNRYWQVLQTFRANFYLYGAYYDNRTLELHRPVIRISAMLDKQRFRGKTYCQLWFKNETKPVFSPVYQYKYIGNDVPGFPYPFLLSCKIPEYYARMVPHSVSLVEKECDNAVTILKVIYNKPKDGKKNFGVCVRGLDFLHIDISVRTIEWLELVFILGAEKVHMYELEIHPNLSKVLEYYQHIGKVELTPYSLPENLPNMPGLMHMYLMTPLFYTWQIEVIPYIDCFYKNMYNYKYITALDVDEVIVPQSTDNWESLMNLVTKKADATKKQYDGYEARNLYFVDDMMKNKPYSEGIPQYMHILQHVYRSAKHMKPHAQVKTFSDTERVLCIHNHAPVACVRKPCLTMTIDTKDAHLQHYRKNCSDPFMKHVIKDTNIWRYKDKLITRVNKVLSEIKLSILF